jgi:hypothetical protein
MCFVAHADDVPLLGALRTSAVIGAVTCNGGYRYTRDGPTEILVPTSPREERHLPEDRDAFHRRDAKSEEIAPSGLHAGTLAHAARSTP